MINNWKKYIMNIIVGIRVNKFSSLMKINYAFKSSYYG